MSVEEFIKERRAGAAKIAKEARAKGGLSLLTAVHFEAKDGAYGLCLERVKKNADLRAKTLTELKEFEQLAVKSAMTATSMNFFQTYTGKQEVYGEVVLFLEHPETVEK